MLLLFACTADPDGLLRKGELAGAAHAWEVAGGAPIDPNLSGIDALARRAQLDATITLPLLAEATPALRLLDRFPQTRTRPLDVPLARMADLGAALDAIAAPPAMWVVGRSENRADKDPWTERGDVPWQYGRLVGFAPATVSASFTAATMSELGKKIDANPPAKLVSLAMSDATGEVFVSFEHSAGAWKPVGTSDPVAAARLLLAAADIQDYGAAGLRERTGGGFRNK